MRSQHGIQIWAYLDSDLLLFEILKTERFNIEVWLADIIEFRHPFTPQEVVESLLRTIMTGTVIVSYIRMRSMRNLIFSSCTVVTLHWGGNCKSIASIYIDSWSVPNFRICASHDLLRLSASSHTKANLISIRCRSTKFISTSPWQD